MSINKPKTITTQSGTYNKPAPHASVINNNDQYLPNNKLNTVKLQENRELLDRDTLNSPDSFSRVLTSSNNGETLRTDDQVLFCSAGVGSVTVDLPDPMAMKGKELKFVNIYNGYESYFSIHGAFGGGGSNYSLNMFLQAVTLVSDGNVWYIVQQYIP